jgi:hypothetical protein
VAARLATACVLAILVLPGCSRLGLGLDLGRGDTRFDVFDGQTFRGGARAPERQDRQTFVATARPASNSLDGAVRAAEYNGIKHCIRYFGTSDIVWEVGPDTAPEALPVADDTLSLRGRCVDR